MYHENHKVAPMSAEAEGFAFFDDFNDGIWTKYPGNPVMTRTEDWETRCICEPSVISEDGILKMWYMGCRAVSGYDASLGYATSKDGFTWEKHPDNPILSDPQDAVIRTTVIKHEDIYYLFASDDQFAGAAGVINRWTSTDGLHWDNKVTVLRPTESWEGPLFNTAVIVDDDGTWQMLYAAGRDSIGYAYSSDGVHWTKYSGNPVIGHGFICDDPFMKKIGDRYFMWYSHCHGDDGRTFCRWSEDMINWHPVYNDPQIGFSQPWERGWDRPEVHWDKLISDPELVEHNGKVLLYYQGAQCPLGVAVFDGTFEQLAERLLSSPPLSKWAESPWGCIENKELKISDNASDKEPLLANVTGLSDAEGYIYEFRACRYAGASYQIKPVVRYVDEGNYARFWILNNETTWYQECRDGRFGGTANIGANNICDAQWHDWKIVVCGATNELYLDGRYVGQYQSSLTLVNQSELKVGLAVFDTYASFDDVRVRRGQALAPGGFSGPYRRLPYHR